LKKNNNSQTTSGQKTKPAKTRGPVQRDAKEVMAELVAKRSERLGPKPAQEQATERKPQAAAAPMVRSERRLNQLPTACAETAFEPCGRIKNTGRVDIGSGEARDWQQSFAS
jgi:hypothetical protein